MPAKITKVGQGYTVRTPTQIHGQHMSLGNAKKQQRLLNAIHYTSWRPTKSKSGLLKHKNRRK